MHGPEGFLRSGLQGRAYYDKALSEDGTVGSVARRRAAFSGLCASNVLYAMTTCYVHT